MERDSNFWMKRKGRKERRHRGKEFSILERKGGENSDKGGESPLLRTREGNKRVYKNEEQQGGVGDRERSDRRISNKSDFFLRDEGGGGQPLGWGSLGSGGPQRGGKEGEEKQRPARQKRSHENRYLDKKKGGGVTSEKKKKRDRLREKSEEDQGGKRSPRKVEISAGKSGDTKRGTTQIEGKGAKGKSSFKKKAPT